MSLKTLVVRARDQAVKVYRKHPKETQKGVALLLALVALKGISSRGDLSKLTSLAQRVTHLPKAALAVILLGAVWSANKMSKDRLYKEGKRQYSKALANYPRPTMTSTAAGALMVLNKLTSGRARLSYKQLGALGAVWGLGPTAYNHRDKIMSVFGKWKLILGTVAAVKGFRSFGGFNLLKKLFGSSQPQPTQQEHSGPSPQVKEVKQDPKPDPKTKQESSPQVEEMVEAFVAKPDDETEALVGEFFGRVEKEQKSRETVEAWAKQHVASRHETQQKMDTWVDKFAGKLESAIKKPNGNLSTAWDAVLQASGKVEQAAPGYREKVLARARPILVPKLGQQLALKALRNNTWDDAWSTIQEESKAWNDAVLKKMVEEYATAFVQKEFKAKAVAEKWAEELIQQNKNLGAILDAMDKGPKLENGLDSKRVRQYTRPFLASKLAEGYIGVIAKRSNKISAMESAAEGVGQVIQKRDKTLADLFMQYARSFMFTKASKM